MSAASIRRRSLRTAIEIVMENTVTEDTNFQKVDEVAFRDIYQLYSLHSQYSAFLVDIDGPFPSIPYSEFYEEYFEDGSPWTRSDELGVSEIFLVHSISESIGSAEINLAFRDLATVDTAQSIVALKRLLPGISEELGVDRLFGFCLVNDELRSSVLLGAGFVEQGRLRKQFFWNGIFHDLLLLTWCSSNA